MSEEYIYMPNEEVLDVLETVPLGGGRRYVEEFSSNIIERGDADVIVDTQSELLNAVGGSANIIWMDSNINLGSNTIRLSNQTIAGDRGQDGSSGPILFSNISGHNSVAFSGGGFIGQIQMNNNSRMTGLRIRGWAHDAFDHPEMPGYIPGPSRSTYPNPSQRRNIYEQHHARAISMRSDNAEVDNCEIYGWATQGIAVGGRRNPSDPHIHHNYIHDCMQTSMGYAVDVRGGVPLIEYNYFNATRHSINGSGRDYAGYELVNNLFGPAHSSHVIDMHRLGNNIDGTNSNFNSTSYIGQAGTYMTVRNNTMLNTITPTWSDAEVTRLSNLDFDWTVSDRGRPARGYCVRGVPWPRSGTVVVVEDNEALQDVSNGYNNPGTYRPPPDVPWQQQVSYDGRSIPQNQRNNRNFGQNWRIGGNVYAFDEEEYNPDKGAPVNIFGGSVADFRATVTDSDGDPIEDATVNFIRR